MVAPSALRSQFTDLFGSSMLPVLEELFRAEVAQHPKRREQLFKVVRTDRDIFQYSELHDMPLFSEMSEGQEYSMQRPKQGDNRTLSISKFGLGFSISEEAVEDGRFDMVSDAIRKMGRSAIESQEIEAMNIFNNGFSGGTEVAADGLSVFNSAHTLPSGGTFRNVPSSDSDLSQSALDSALVDFETQFVGDSGIIYNIKPRILLVAPANKRYAMELVGSELKADTSDNNMNSLKSDGLIVVSSPHLTDSDAWFLLGAPEETGLRIAQRKGIETKASDPAVGFLTDSIYYKARYREAIGVMHAYGIWGCDGV